MAALTPFEEFPAAHSMDTEWFAVDANGQVARFDTAEEGALPRAAAQDSSAAGANFDVNLLTALRVARLFESGVDPAQGIEPEALAAGDVLTAVEAKTRAAALIALAHVGDFFAFGSSSPWILLSKAPVSAVRAQAVQQTQSVRWAFNLPSMDELDADDVMPTRRARPSHP